MIKCLKYEEIDRERWDQCIDRSFNALPYAYSWYLDIVCEDWSGLVEGDYERVMPLNLGQKFFIPYIFQPFFTQQLGVFSQGLLSANKVKSFINHIPEKYKYGELNFNSQNKIPETKLPYQDMPNFELDLISPYPLLKANYSKNTLRNLKKSKDKGLKIVHNLQPETLVSLFQMNKGGELKHIKEKHYMRLTRLMHTLIHRAFGEIHAVVSAENEVVAAAFFIRNSQRLIFFFSAISQGGKEQGAMFYLIDQCINQYSGTNLILDFEGSADANLARFYKGWGAQNTHYYRYVFKKLPSFIMKVHAFMQKIKK